MSQAHQLRLFSKRNNPKVRFSGLPFSCPTQKYLRFRLAVSKIVPIFATVKQRVAIRNRRVRVTSSPELIRFRWAYFYAHVAALLQ